jgi:hypothetical protein
MWCDVRSNEVRSVVERRPTGEHPCNVVGAIRREIVLARAQTLCRVGENNVAHAIATQFGPRFKFWVWPGGVLVCRRNRVLKQKMNIVKEA